jgi:hypothetical protein
VESGEGRGGEGVVLGMIRMVNDSGSGPERGVVSTQKGKDEVEKEV